MLKGKDNIFVNKKWVYRNISNLNKLPIGKCIMETPQSELSDLIQLDKKEFIIRMRGVVYASW